MVVLAFFMLIHVELSLKKEFAPENVLIQVVNDDGRVDVNASCFGYVLLDNEIVTSKYLERLDSIYDFVDSDVYFLEEDRGYHLLATNLTKYDGIYKIEIGCVSSDNKETGFVVLNNTNNNCDFNREGNFVIC